MSTRAVSENGRLRGVAGELVSFLSQLMKIHFENSQVRNREVKTYKRKISL